MGVFWLQLLHTHITEQQLAGALNCSIVGLASHGPASQAREELSYTSGDNASGSVMTLGLGFVRSVDAKKGLLYLLTDVSSKVLQQVNVLQVRKMLSRTHGLKLKTFCLTKMLVTGDSWHF